MIVANLTGAPTICHTQRSSHLTVTRATLPLVSEGTQAASPLAVERSMIGRQSEASHPLFGANTPTQVHAFIWSVAFDLATPPMAHPLYGASTQRAWSIRAYQGKTNTTPCALKEIFARISDVLLKKRLGLATTTVVTESCRDAIRAESTS